jgi:phage tail sheath protein FI
VLRRTADGVLQREGADGAVAGLIARRTRERGAWIAPANEALRGIVALSDAATEGAMGALLDARVNLLAATPRGLMPLNADTLGAGNAAGAGDDLRALAARRLLQLLRRLALREGQAWVFEPHDGAFRRGVQRSLEAILRGLFERGAFAGRRADDSFQVVAESEGLNTRASADAGRFVVELRVAPARPMAFVTVRLVRSGDGLALE